LNAQRSRRGPFAVWAARGGRPSANASSG
jgi:hypothetical protein